MILFLTTLVLGSLVMLATWWWSRRLNNYGIVDAVWSFLFLIHALIFSALAPGWAPRRLLIFLLVALWSFRLGFFLARRISSHHPEEDTRYQKLRLEYEPRVAQRFFWFFQYQAWSVSLLTVPFLLIALNLDPQFSLFEIAGASLWFIAVLGESIADRQMSAFKKNPANRGKTCDVGLWRYSRHPNYFFESCIWWAFFIFALGSPYGWATVYAPLTILFLLLKVTGVPPSEAQALKSRGEEYRRYQRRTSMFVPWFPKRDLP